VKLHRLFVAALCACSPPALGATLHVDDFESSTSTLGWSGGGVPTHIATGGPAGAGDAFIRVPNSSNLATFNSEPAWTGNLAAIGAAQVNVDLMSPATSQPLQIRFVLFGPGSTNIRWTSTLAQAVPNDGVWRSYVFSLAEGDLTRVLGLSTYAAMMADVFRVMFRHDPGSPSSEGEPVTGTLNLDNIELAADVPDVPGDFNGDGTVDGDDLTDPVNGWGARFAVDLDGNDFLIWQRNLGVGAAAAATAASYAIGVPEPNAAMLCWPSFMAVLSRRRICLG